MASEEEYAASWVVLYCPSDDSHVLVCDAAVLYDDRLLEEDEVKFDYPGSKKLLTGVVKGFSSDKKAMVKLMNQLNTSTKPKRETSFHADVPRRAAVKAKQSLVTKIKTSSVLSKVLRNPDESDDPDLDSSSESSKAQPLSSGAIKCDNSNPLLNSNDDKDDSDSVTEDELTEEEKAVLAKLAAKKEMKRFKNLAKENHAGTSSNFPSMKHGTSIDLSYIPDIQGSAHVSKLNFQNSQAVLNEKELAKNPSNSDASNETPEKRSSSGKDGFFSMEHSSTDLSLNPDIEVKGSTDASKLKTSQAPPTEEGLANNRPSKSDSSKEQPKKTSETVTEENTNANGTGKRHAESNSDDEKETKALKKSRRKKKSKTDVVQITFEGQHYNWKATDPKVIKLVDDQEVYILERDLRKAKTQGVFSTVTAMARFLTRAVYTEEARNVCSVSGKPSLSKGKALPEQRTMLDSMGVEAIIEFVTKRGERKNWKVPPPSAIKQSMGNMLCEERPRPEQSTE